MRRIAALLLLLGLLATAPAAVAQQDPFGPLPQPVPEVTPLPTPEPTFEEQSDSDRTLLLAIGGGLLLLFLAIGYVITRDARNTLPEAERAAATAAPRSREDEPRRRPKEAKAKARARAKAQRAARRHNR